MRSLFVLLVLGLASPPASAYVRTMSDSGRPLYWNNPNLAVQANPRNASGLSDAEVGQMLSGAFAAWRVPGTRADARYSQGPGVAPGTNLDGTNKLYFSTAANRRLDFGVVAMTEVYYYVSSGEIAEADMVFNDHQFLFTANEGDTGKYVGGKRAIFLQDVATHEAGHAYGLDHGLVNLSSLIYTAFSGQFVPGKDDLTGIKTVYPSASGNGAITGRVMGTKGGVFGAHVQAINLETGKVQAGILTNPDGTFRLGDLEPGSYSLLMEPFGTSVSSVSRYFEQVNHAFCGGSREFRRRFFGPCGSNEVNVVQVSPNAASAVGVLSPACAQMGNPGGVPDSALVAVELPAEGGARFGTIALGDTHYYRINNAGGPLSVRALSYSLYSPMDISVTILDRNGAPLADATSVDNVQQPMPGGYVNYDSVAWVDRGGDYLVRVRATAGRLPASDFPAGYDLLDADGHYLLVASVNGSPGLNSSGDMSACVTLNNRPQNASFRAPASQKKEGNSAGCGTLGGPGGGGPLSGGIALVLAAAALLQLGSLLARRKRALVRKDR